MGYSNVYVFRGGLPEWIKAGYPVTTVEKLPKEKVPNIKPDELKKLLDSGANLALVDIRPAAVASRYWIEVPQRLHLELDGLVDRYAEVPQGKKVVLMDLNGKRSNLAGRYLKLKGYGDVVRLNGGIEAWMKAGNAVKKGG